MQYLIKALKSDLWRREVGGVAVDYRVEGSCVVTDPTAVSIDLIRLQPISAALRTELAQTISIVAADGGAIGWLTAPHPDEVRRWVDRLAADVERGEAALALASRGDDVVAMATWRRSAVEVRQTLVEVSKVMVQPQWRRRGLARALTEALIIDARAAGIETLELGLRGNNHVALHLYESLGFQVWGRLPNALAVNELRFDDVHMYLQFPNPPGVIRRGSQAGGPGGSPPTP